MFPSLLLNTNLTPSSDQNDLLSISNLCLQVSLRFLFLMSCRAKPSMALYYDPFQQKFQEALPILKALAGSPWLEPVKKGLCCHKALHRY
jgi:hypothetical protein